MISFESKIHIDSITAPGVSFTIRRLNQIQRAKRDLDIARQSERMDRLTRDWRAATKELKPTDPVEDPELLRLAEEINREYTASVLPLVIRAGLISIEGIEIDGAPATLDTLLASGPEQLIQEIHDACRAASGLSEEQQKNLLLPGASPGQADGKASDTTAGTAAA